MTKHLWKFSWDCGRMGGVDGMFIATTQEIDAALGKYVYFGEILGKHSEVCGTLTSEDVEIVSSEADKIEWLQSVFGTSVMGYNPLDYIEED